MRRKKMKKIILTGVFVALCIPTFAQETLYEGNFRCDFDPGWICEQVKRGIQKVFSSSEKVEWAREVKAEEEALKSSPITGMSSHYASARSFEIKKGNEETQKYIDSLNEALKSNDVLKNYALFAPEPDDILLLEKLDRLFVSNFFKKPIDKEEFNKDSRHTYYTPAVSHPTKNAPETQLVFNVNGKQLILLIDSRSSTHGDKLVKSIYFFVNRVPKAKK